MRDLLPLLREHAPRLGFSLTGEHLRQFQTYYEMLVDWNSRVNLTAITDYEGVQVRHFLDSLTVGSALLAELSGEPPDGFRLLDIGAGAGFPSLPLKIAWPQMEVVLADSIGKKTAFLRAVVGELGLDSVEVLTERAEELGADKRHREKYDAVTARAVASLPVLCEYCLPLGKVGGRMLAPKKGDISQELEQARKASKILGGSDPRVRSFTLPGEAGERYVIVMDKVRATPTGYPRRVGLAKARPLGGG